MEYFCNAFNYFEVKKWKCSVVFIAEITVKNVKTTVRMNVVLVHLRVLQKRFLTIYVCEMCKVILFSSVGSIIRMLEIIFADFNCYIKENDIELTKLHQRILSNKKTDYEEKLFDAIMSFRSSMMFVNPAFVGNEQYITFEKRQALYNFYCNYKNLVLKSSDSDSFKFESKIKIYSEV